VNVNRFWRGAFEDELPHPQVVICPICKDFFMISEIEVHFKEFHPEADYMLIPSKAL